MKILTWLWHQDISRFHYTAAHVNAWAKAIRANTTLDIELACVTDMPKGIDKSIEIIPLPDEFDYKVAKWRIDMGLPQCFRRISMFSPKAEKVFGKRFASVDLDMVVFGNLDHVFGCQDDFRMLRGGSGSRPYNGSLLMMDAGARPEVYEKFSPEAAEEACKKYVGSDQAWISYCLGWGEEVFSRQEHGIYFLSRGVFRRLELDDNIKLAFFPGEPKFFMNRTFHRAVKSEVDKLNAWFGKDHWDRALAADDPVDLVIRISKKPKPRTKKTRTYRLR